jgi:hypothetical protein
MSNYFLQAGIPYLEVTAALIPLGSFASQLHVYDLPDSQPQPILHNNLVKHWLRKRSTNST